MTRANVKVMRTELHDEPASRWDMAKKFCQCFGLASLLLVVNYGDLLGGGADVRMHVPYRLIADLPGAD